ncbi:MAG TPA: DUF4340 domain-containing protein [Cyclobacteriaceae bacterium]
MKQEQKNKILIGTLLAMVMVAAVILLFKSKNDQVDKGVFKMDNLAAIDRIQFESQGQGVELSFNGSRWLVNNDYDADDQMVTVLFATLQQVEVKRKVAASRSDSIATRLKKNGTKVSLFIGTNLEKEMLVGGNAGRTEAYFMTNDNIPYLMAVPGYRVYAGGVFELDQNGWRDKRIFNFNWRNFKKLTAQFSDSNRKGFEIEDMGFGFDINNTTGTDTTKLNDYLDAVSLLMAKNFINSGENEQYDSILQAKPDVIIEILDLGDNKFSLNLYRPIKGDEQVVGKLNGTEGVLFDRQQVLPLQRGQDYFLIKSP